MSDGNNFGGLDGQDGGFGGFGNLGGFVGLLPDPAGPPTDAPVEPGLPPQNAQPGAPAQGSAMNEEQATQAFMAQPMNYGPPSRPAHLVEFPVDPFSIHRPPYMAPAQTARQRNPGGIFSGAQPQRVPGGLAGPADPAAAAASGSSGLGLALLAVAGGAVIGGMTKGWAGAISGAVIGGALVNGYKAARCALQGTPEDDREAAVAGTFALLGAGGAAYLLYRVGESEDEKKGKTTATKNGGASATPNAQAIVGMEPIDADEAEPDESSSGDEDEDEDE